MPFDMPTADRARLNELLNVLGDRAEDFRKCFDTESEWCWKYADLMLRGMQRRELEYAEGHHVVPACFYGKRNSAVNEGNLTTLTYGEHLYAHYCAALCGIGKMKGNMAMAFRIMYNMDVIKSKPILPEEQELIDSIPGREVRRILIMEPSVSRVEIEGRTHFWENPKQARKDYYEANKERIAEKNKAYREANKERIQAYRKANKETIAERMKAYRESNKETIAVTQKAYKAANKDKIADYNKSYKAANKDKISEQRKHFYEAKKAAGFCFRKNPATGKREWVFVGLPGIQESLCA